MNEDKVKVGDLVYVNDDGTLTIGAIPGRLPRGTVVEMTMDMDGSTLLGVKLSKPVVTRQETFDQAAEDAALEADMLALGMCFFERTVVGRVRLDPREVAFRSGKYYFQSTDGPVELMHEGLYFAINREPMVTLNDTTETP